MANNLKKFTTEAEYTAATLNYPAVSWVTSGDTVHFDKAAPVVANDKVMMAWTSSNHGGNEDIVLFNGGASTEPAASVYFTAITLNDVDVKSSADANNGTLYNYAEASTDYLAKYDISTTSIIDYFAGDLGGGFASDPQVIDFLIPSQITEIQHLPYNVSNLVVEAATPPTVSLDWSVIPDVNIFVPDDAVNTYKAASGWSDMMEVIFPISQYSGNLPV